MALTQTQVSQLYVSIFGRASEGAGNTYWQATADMATAANTMLATSAAATYFGTSLSADLDFVKHIYLNTLGKTYAQDTAGVDGWVTYLATHTRGEMVAALVYAAQQPANAGAAQDMFNNKVAVSNYCADNIQTADVANLTAFTSYISGVTSDAATVTAAKSTIAAAAPADFTLTSSATADTIIGTAASDMISGPSGTVANGDLILDQSTADSDTANLVLTANYTPTNITKVENINIDWDAYTTPTYALAGVKEAKVVNLTSSKVGYLGSATVTGATGFELVAGSGIVGTLTASGFKTGTVTGTNAKTLVVDGTTTAANNASIVVNAGTNTTGITIGGTTGFISTTVNAGTATTLAVTDAGNTTDTTTITVNADATITNGNTGATTLVLSDGNDITMAAIGNGLTIQGTGDVSLISTGITTETITNAKTAGTLTVKTSTVGAQDVSKVQANLIEFTGIKNGADTVKNGANLKYSAASTTSIDITVAGTGTSDAVSAILTGATHTAVEATGVETLSITAAATAISGADLSIGTLTTNANTIKLLGTNDVAIAAVADEAGNNAGTIDASALAGTLSVTMASATDSVAIKGGTGILTFSTSNASGDVSVVAQDANDTVTANSLAGGSLTAIMGNGNNTVTADTALAGGTLVVTGGSGIDTVTAGAALTTGTINLNLGDGANVVNLDDAAGAGTRDVTTGGGDDTLTFTGSLDDANDVLKWTAGAGTDTLILATDGADLSVSKITLSGVEVIKIKVDGGADATAEAKIAAEDVSGTTMTIKASAYNANNQVEFVGAAATTTVDLSGLTIDQSLTNGIAGVIVTSTAATAAQTITGTSIADTIVAGGFADTIVAGNGADTITGGNGNDSIDITETTANSAVDTIILNASGSGVDTITGFKTGTDKITLGNAATASIAGAAEFGTTAATVVAGAVAFDTSDVTAETTDVIEIAATLSSYGDLDLATTGAELLKALSSTSTAASQITLSAAADTFLIAYQDSKAYLYFASSADANLVASEITLVGVLNNITAGSLVVADFVEI